MHCCRSKASLPDVENRMKYNYLRIAFLILASFAGVASSIWLAEPLHTSEKPSEYIGLVYSVLSATLFAVVSILGDPSMLLPGNVRLGWESAKRTQKEIHFFNIIFYTYIITLGLLVFSEIVESEQWRDLYFVHNIFAFFAAFGFVMSLLLPAEFSAIQRRRLESEIGARKLK